MGHEEDLKSLAILTFILISLLILAAFWCLLSTCVGPPILDIIAGWWEAALESAQLNRGRRRGGYDYQYQPLEQWEMRGTRNRMA